MSNPKKIRNWTYTDLGRVVAEQDVNLVDYYVSPSKYVERASDVNDSAVFYVGPKGIGKSAILQMVRLTLPQESNRIINITPDNLAFSALANIEVTTPILNMIGKQKWFFKSIWDYLLTVEILRREYKNQTWLRQSVGKLYRSPFEKKAQKLLDTCLKDDGKPVNLMNTIIDLLDSVELSAETDSAKIAANIKADKKSEGNKNLELFSIINSVAKDTCDNIKHNYYIVIDDLDQNWRNDPVQNEFLSGLFQSLKNFSKPPRIKCLVSMREDIYKNIIIQDRDKFHDWVCNVKWDFSEIKEMVTLRVHKKTGLNRNMIWGGLFPENGFDFLFKHTQERPRELIRLTHLCLEGAKQSGRNQIEKEDMIKALKLFSEEKIEDLASEKHFLYPYLNLALKRFRGWPKEFSYKQFKSEYAEMINLEIVCKEGNAIKYSWAGGYDKDAKGLAVILLEVGFLLFKSDEKSRTAQYDIDNPQNLTENTWLAIHPVYCSGLNLKGD